jgi:hypothetical protein
MTLTFHDDGNTNEEKRVMTEPATTHIYDNAVGKDMLVRLAPRLVGFYLPALLLYSSLVTRAPRDNQSVVVFTVAVVVHFFTVTLLWASEL